MNRYIKTAVIIVKMFANMKIQAEKNKRRGRGGIKKDFNEVVRENTDFVMSIVRKFVRNTEIAKDLTQEIFIKAYLSYEYYTEAGKIRAWLSVIAHNKLKNYYKAESARVNQVEFVPLEDYMPARGQSPEDIAGQNDFTERIVRIINTLPRKQRDVIFYSVMHGYTEKEIAVMQDIPVGSVKSAKHYGLERVRKLILDNDLVTRKVNNMGKLSKQDAYALLYQYAKGHISSEDKAAVEAYMREDEEAADVAEALRELHGKLTFARDDELTLCHISFFIKSGHAAVYTYNSMLTPTDSVYYAETTPKGYKGYKKLDIAPNLYEVNSCSYMGVDAKVAIYTTLPENAVNIRVKRGNGVLECGKYKFIYADRYVAEDEGIHAECTFNLE